MADRTFEVREIATVSSPRDVAIDDDWGAVESSITLVDDYPAEALAGLDGFSHLEVIFVFDRVDPGTVTTGARVPRNNPAWPAVGIFAQRAKNRPNRLGLCTCEVVAVDGPHDPGPRPRRHRRHAGARPQALPGGVRTPPRDHPAGLVPRADGRVLLTPRPFWVYLAVPGHRQVHPKRGGGRVRSTGRRR